MHKIFRIGHYRLHERLDNCAIVSGSSPLDAIQLFESAIEALMHDFPLTRNYKFLGRADDTGTECPERKIIFIDYPYKKRDWTNECDFHASYLRMNGIPRDPRLAPPILESETATT